MEGGAGGEGAAAVEGVGLGAEVEWVVAGGGDVVECSSQVMIRWTMLYGESTSDSTRWVHRVQTRAGAEVW